MMLILGAAFVGIRPLVLGMAFTYVDLYVYFHRLHSISLHFVRPPNGRDQALQVEILIDKSRHVSSRTFSLVEDR